MALAGNTSALDIAHIYDSNKHRRGDVHGLFQVLVCGSEMNVRCGLSYRFERCVWVGII